MVNGPGGGRRRDNMARDFARNGRGWSQPGTGNGTNGRKLPRTPHGAINAMAALQGMLGINQTNLSSMLNINGSMNNINNSISNVSGIGLMNSAVRRLPSVPMTGQVPTTPITAAVTAAQQQQQQQQQGSWISKLFKKGPTATPQQETNQRLQQQLMINQQQSNMNQQQLLAGQQPLMQGVAGVPSMPGAQGVQGVAPASVMSGQTLLPGQYPPFQMPNAMSVSASMNQLPLLNGHAPPLPQHSQVQPLLQPPLQPPQPPPKKPGEGWGGRGARLPKVPVPLPSLPPNKSSAYNGSHSFEEIEEDLFLDRIVAVGRGSRKLPNPADAKRPGKRLTRQNGVFKRGFSLDSDEYDAQDTFRP